jgi:hypothetical protein
MHLRSLVEKNRETYFTVKYVHYSIFFSTDTLYFGNNYIDIYYHTHIYCTSVCSKLDLPHVYVPLRGVS